MIKQLQKLRWLAAVLCFAANFTAGAYDFMEDGLCYNINSDGKSVTVTYQQNPISSNGYNKSYSNISRLLVIPSSVCYNGNNYSVTSIDGFAFCECSGLTSVNIPNSVTSIGQEAFEGCSGLMSVDISNLEAWCNISFCDWTSNPLYYAHHLYLNDTEVKDLKIPNTVTSIGGAAFVGCTGLTSVTIPNSITSIGMWAFYLCTSLTSVTWNAIACPDLENLSQAIFPSSVQSFVFGDDVQRIPAYLCQGMTGLKSVTIGKSVTSIAGSAFSGCSGLTNVIWNAIACTDVYITIFPSSVRNFVFGDDVQRIPACLCQGMTGLTSLAIPNSVTFIGECAFSGCSGFMGSLTIPNSVTYIDNSAFSGCSGFTGSLTIGNSVTSIGSAAFSGCSGFTGSLTIPNSVTEIGWSAFSGCSGFTGSLTIGNSVKTIGSYAFSGCSGFTGSLTIGNSVTYIDEYDAFGGCNGFTKLIFNAVECADFKYSYWRNEKPPFDDMQFKELVIGDSVKRIPAYLLRGCNSITGSLTIPESTTSIGEYSLHGSFTGTLTIPKLVSYIGNNAFSGEFSKLIFNAENCSDFSPYYEYDWMSELGYSAPFRGLGIKELVIGDAVKRIPNYFLDGCEISGRLTIPESVSTIGGHAFSGLSGLTGSLKLPKSLTSIGDEAFAGCSGFIGTLNIPCSVTSVGNDAFSGCGFSSMALTGSGAMNNTNGNLNNAIPVYVGSGITGIKGLGLTPSEAVYAYASVPPELNNCAFNTYNATLHVPQRSLAAYIGAPYWNQFANIVGDAVELESLELSDTVLTIGRGQEFQLFADIMPTKAAGTLVNWSSSRCCASVSNDGIVSANDTGEAVIYATCDGFDAYCHVTVVDVYPESLQLNEESVNLKIGEKKRLVATVTPTNTSISIKWRSTDPSVVSVNNGLIEGLKVGEADVVVTCATLEARCHVTVNQDYMTIITLDKHELILESGTTVMLTPTSYPTSVDSYTVSSSDTSVATTRLLNGRVQVAAARPGVAIITVSDVDGKACPDSCMVTVVRPANDASGDGYIDIDDLNLLINVILEIIPTPQGEELPYYDVDGSGNVDVDDLNVIINIILGKDSSSDIQYVVNGVRFKMVAVQGGTFTMGATAEQGSDAQSDESPTHSVTLSDYYIGTTEVTQALWVAVMGNNPSKYTGDMQRPVEWVSWDDCQAFITKLNQLTGESFRLSTEAEWEYAARGGKKCKGYKYAGGNTTDDVAWYASNSKSTTHAVATKSPNELGLYDMSGNVWEWCQDYFSNIDYSSSPSTNPTGPTTGTFRTLRGGSWYDNASRCSVSERHGIMPSDTNSNLGLRLAR